MPLHVLEYLRDPHGVFTLPGEHLPPLIDEFPDVRFSSPQDRAGADRLLPEADIVLGWAARRENFATATRLKWIQVTAAGVGGYLFPALVESDVVLTNGRGLHGVAMAEHALGMILAFIRKLHLARDAQRERRWTQTEAWRDGPPFGELAGGTLVLVGLGSVGTPVAERARALGLHVIAVRKRPAADPAPAHEQWGLDRLGAMLERADWVVLAAPHTQASHHMVAARELARMKPTAVLVNLGRGALVDEAALVDALRSGTIAGAGLDVFEEEPLPAGSPLWDMPNVIVTPHTSGLGPRYWERSIDLFRRNLRAYVEGRPLENVVDKRAGY